MRSNSIKLNNDGMNEGVFGSTAGMKRSNLKI